MTNGVDDSTRSDDVEGSTSKYSAMNDSSTHPELLDGVRRPGNGADTGVPSHVNVIAPSELPEGYQFTVIADNRALIVSVPDGGVKEGQQFTAPVIGEDDTVVLGTHQNIPTGDWRDELFDCCRLGICHPQVCLSCWCTPIALGQVLTRLQLDWFANPITSPKSCSAFKFLAFTCLIWFVVDNVIYNVTHYHVTYSEYGNPYPASNWARIVDSIRSGIGYSYGIYLLILTIRARSHVRSKYSIPEQQCKGCEDCCCSFWCHCCVVAQMARHINDYDHHTASC